VILFFSVQATYRLGYEALWRIVKEDVNRRLRILARAPEAVERNAAFDKKVGLASYTRCIMSRLSLWRRSRDRCCDVLVRCRCSEEDPAAWLMLYGYKGLEGLVGLVIVI
jgi:hypothetical protein